MGDRGQILIEDENVYLYAHWGATELKKTLKNALVKKRRWGDPEYLARIIFCEMVKGVSDPYLSYGIGGSKHGDIWRLIKVNSSKNQIIVLDHEQETFRGTFEEFIKEN